MTSSGGNSEDGCCSCLVGIVALALVLAALISLAAIVDPFGWMPPVGEIWEDCTDDPLTETGECDLDRRFPGFWWHAIVNLAFTVAAGLALLAFAGLGSDLRRHREARFDSAEAAGEYAASQAAFAAASAALAALAGLPILVGIL